MAGAVQRLNGSDFPVGTLAVNITGSFVLGLIMVLSIERGLINANLRILLATGFCGGFTTMSTFSYESMALLRDGTATFALFNLVATIAGCWGAVWLAGLLARWV
jgi:CrcB protein